MTESEFSALLDAHDALLKAYVDSSLAFSVFVSAYADFLHNYALAGHSGTAEGRAVLRICERRIAFHLRVSAVLSGLRSASIFRSTFSVVYFSINVVEERPLQI